MVRGIVKNYGGKVMVQSELGKGTVFDVYLPVTTEPDESDQNEIEPLTVGHERVLFIDDEPPVAKMGGRMLEQLGYRVTTQSDSVVALELFRAAPHDFDLVISDVTMPGMCGDKFALELLKIRRDIPIILCTGYSKRITDEHILEYGAKALISKPIDKRNMARTIREVLGKVPGNK